MRRVVERQPGEEAHIHLARRHDQGDEKHPENGVAGKALLVTTGRLQQIAVLVDLLPLPLVLSLLLGFLGHRLSAFLPPVQRLRLDQYQATCLRVFFLYLFTESLPEQKLLT